jgi:hypothetical protein
MTDAFVSPQGRVLGSIAPDSRIIAIDRASTASLLLGRRGSWVVELAASWAIVLIVTGLYLWWPRGRGLAGTLWPRLAGRAGVLARSSCGDGVLGVGAGAGAAVHRPALGRRLGQRLPRGAAGDGLGARADGLDHRRRRRGGAEADGEHDHAAMMAAWPICPAWMKRPRAAGPMAAMAAAAHLAFPVLVVPPGMPSGEGGSGKAADWSCDPMRRTAPCA